MQFRMFYIHACLPSMKNRGQTQFYDLNYFKETPLDTSNHKYESGHCGMKRSLVIHRQF